MDYNNPVLTVKTQFRADDQAVLKALETASNFIERAGCGGDAEARLRIIVEELVANLVEHGNPPADSEIALELAAIGADIGLTLSDSCTPFDIRTVDIPDEIPPERGGGAGIALVLNWSRVIDYTTADGRNVLTLVIPDHV